MKYLPTIILALLLGLTGAAADPQADKPKQKPLIKEFMGLNGHFQFKPELYKQTCRLVRNYHNLRVRAEITSHFERLSRVA